ncbi:hypothetical protein [Gilliamella sp. Bif1-4]|uniref:hypothetical protein n=1 Tax=Gilliamella sp. Bif1-4 TaxID=3120233 RepID=UPI00080E6A4D|nr:hypothetical protein [Gilliamella apicola]OCG41548.1 hypothetical protein A9G25_05355 [Gilliamella apicola]
MKKYFYLALLILMVILTGCDKSKTKLKNDIEAALQVQEKPFCFYLGKVTFPYLKQDLSYPTHERADVWVNNELNRRLEIFSRLGLLEYSLDAENQTKRYQLVKLNSETEFKEGSFCFGKVTLNKLVDYDNEKDVNTFINVSYTVENIPSWVNNDIFLQYFYFHQINTNKQYANSDYSYPSLINKQFPNELRSRIELAKLVNGEFIINDKNSIRKSFFYNIDNDNSDFQHFTYAYYDAKKARNLRNDFIKYKRQINDWGKDLDPVLFEKVKPSSNLARSTNLVVMYYYFDHALTQNRIKSAKGTVKDKLLDSYAKSLSRNRDVTFEMNFDNNGLVSNFVAIFNQGNYKNKRIISSSEDIKTEVKTWKFYDHFTMSLPSKNQNHLNPLATDDYEKIDLFNIFQTDYKNKFIQIGIDSDELQPVSVSYDPQDRILSLGEHMTFQYDKNNQLISTVLDKTKYIMEYNKQGQLIKMKKYINSKKKASLECNFSGHNEKGDWTIKDCDDYKITTRTIEYYE